MLLTSLLLVLSVSAQKMTATVEAVALPDEFTTQTNPASLIDAYYDASLTTVSDAQAAIDALDGLSGCRTRG